MGKKVGKNLIKAVFNGNLWKNCGLFGYVINKKAAKKMVKLTTPIDNYIDISRATMS